MNWFEPHFFSRRDFLKVSSLSIGAAALNPWLRWSQLQEEWPDAERLGRVCIEGKIDIRSRPSPDAPSVGVLYEDAIIPWLREVVGEPVPLASNSRRWVETPDGYVFAPNIQPVRNQPNKPVSELMNTSLGKGMWVEVTVPHTQLFLENETPSAPWLKDRLAYGLIPRLYFSQVVWVDDIQTNSMGQVLYRVNERWGYGDLLWAAAEAFRPLTDEDLAPINPEIENKKIVVDVSQHRQMLSCYEGNTEIYSCLISSGAVWNSDGQYVDNWGTPIGPHPIWRKVISLHMSGGATGAGFDTPGIAWTTLFIGEGVAIHSTFWHNDFGTPRSHGCVNAAPEDAKFIFRWTLPQIVYDPGDLTVQMPGGTTVDVIEA